jgi:hypothetical protein
VLEPSAIRLPHANGTLEETADPVALGFEYTVELSPLDHAEQTRTWQERRLVVRSLAFATSQEQHLRQRVARAVTEINALDGPPATNAGICNMCHIPVRSIYRSL